jgi:hypothetical protein
LAEALETGEQTLSPAVLKSHAPSVDRCDQMITEIEEGEKLLTQDDEAESRLWVRLGLTLPRAGPKEKEQNAQPSDRVSASGVSYHQKYTYRPIAGSPL